MQIGKIERKLNQWQFRFIISKNVPFRFIISKNVPWKKGFFPYIQLACFKLLSFPEEGTQLTKSNYKGIFWEYDFFNHWEIILHQWNFYIAKKRFYIVLPIKIKHLK